MDEVTRRRLQSIENSRDITPVELLRMVLDDIERGEINPDGLVVIWCRRPKAGDDRGWECGTYRANMTRDQELVQLRLAERRCMRSWFDEDL